MDSPLRDRHGRAHNTKLADRADFHDINWHHYTHPQLYDMVHTPDLNHISDQAREWTKLASAIDDTTTDVRRTLSNLFATWQGAAAETAKAANERLRHWAEEMTGRTVKISDGLTSYSATLFEARVAMPPPEFAWAENAANHGDPFKMMRGPSGAIEVNQLTDDQQPNFEKHHAAWQEAVRVMSAYGRHSQDVHDELPPHYEPAPVAGDPNPSTMPGPYPIPDPLPRPLPVPPWSPGHVNAPGDLNGDGIPDGTTPEGYTTTGPGTGFVGGPGGAGGGDPTRGGPGSGGFSGGGGLSGGGPLAARAGFPGARGAGGAANSLFPPGAAGARGQGEEDAEHTTKYVEKEDWLDDDLPPFSNGVIGAW